MVKNDMGKMSDGRIKVKKDFCVPFDFEEGEWYEFWKSDLSKEIIEELGGDIIWVEDIMAQDCVKDDIHIGFMYSPDIAEEIEYYDNDRTDG